MILEGSGQIWPRCIFWKHSGSGWLIEQLAVYINLTFKSDSILTRVLLKLLVQKVKIFSKKKKIKSQLGQSSHIPGQEGHKMIMFWPKSWKYSSDLPIVCIQHDNPWTERQNTHSLTLLVVSHWVIELKWQK